MLKTTNIIAQFLVILMWTYAAASKLIIYNSYRFELLSHQLIREHAHIIAWLVPAIELSIVLLIIIEKTRRMGLYLSAVLLLLFTGYIIYMFQFYPATPCSCGGISSSLSWQQHIVFNICFAGLSLVAVRQQHRPEITIAGA